MTEAAKEHTCVFGMGWGDEGKGKVVDLLCPAFDLVVRFNGGANAGHTVCVGEETYAMHLLPAGVLHEGVTGVIGPGVVVDPVTLLSEIDSLAARGFEVSRKLKISDRAHLVLAYHKLEDRLSERAAGEGARLGTTARGIGPCYADKMRRTTSIRFSDLISDRDLSERVRGIVASREAMLRALYGGDFELDAAEVLADLSLAKARLSGCVCDTTALLHDAIGAGRTVLFEAANGVLLDVDHGTYPYVTSSSTGPYGIGAGAGVPPWHVTRRIGTIKAYATRVGSGPFVTELDDDTGDRIRQRGKEFGTTTGRPRRCGWFDAVSCAYAARLAGATDIALMHLDTLSGFERVGVCVAYRIDGKRVTTMGSDPAVLERAVPEIEFLPGWHDDVTSVRRFEDLPSAATQYIARIEALVGVPITLAGVGPERSQTLARGPISPMIRLSEITVA